MTEEKLSYEQRCLLGSLDIFWAVYTNHITINPKEEKARNQLKAIIEGKVSDEWLKDWLNEDFFLMLWETADAVKNGELGINVADYRIQERLKKLLEDYHKELMK